MDEYIDLVNANGIPTGKTALKSEAHKNGWYHNTVHLWLYTQRGEVLLQQRSRKKRIHPLLWDVSVAGHADAGEELAQAVIRETKEEIALSLNAKELHKIGVHRHETVYDFEKIKDFEFHHIYLAELKVPLNELIPQDGEVEALKLISLGAFENYIATCGENLHFIASNKDYYLFVLNAIKSKLDL